MCVSKTGSTGNQYKSNDNNFFLSVVMVDTGEEIFKISIKEAEQMKKGSKIMSFEFVKRENGKILVRTTEKTREVPCKQ